MNQSEPTDDERVHLAMQVIRREINRDVPTFADVVANVKRPSRPRAWPIAAALLSVAAAAWFSLQTQMRPAPSIAPAQQAHIEEQTSPMLAKWFPIREPEPLQFLLDLPEEAAPSVDGLSPIEHPNPVAAHGAPTPFAN